MNDQKNKSFLGCFGKGFLLFVVCALLFSFLGGAMLSSKVDVLKSDIDDIRANEKPERPVLFGPEEDGNAVEDYRAIEWVLGPRTHWSEENRPEGMPEPDLDFDHEKKLELPLSAGAKIEKGEALSEEEREAYETYSLLTRHVRAGLKKKRCVWDEFVIEDGAVAKIPNLIALRSVANLMAWEALNAETDEQAVRIGLMIAAFGSDCGRHPSLIGKMIGIGVQSVGLKSLVLTMRRRPLHRELYQEIIDTLGKLEAISVKDAMILEGVVIRLALAELGGRRLGKEQGTAPGGVDGFAARYMMPTTVFARWEWGGVDDLRPVLEEMGDLRYTERQEKAAEFDEKVEGSTSIYARIALPNLTTAYDHLDESTAQRRIVAMLAAAHIRRLETGKLPTKAEDLTAILGEELPEDPFSKKPAPLRLKLEGDELRCYSVWLDQKDDGGDLELKNRKDFGFATAAPK